MRWQLGVLTVFCCAAALSSCGGGKSAPPKLSPSPSPSSMVTATATPTATATATASPALNRVTNLADAGPGSLRAVLAAAPSGATVTFASSLTGSLVLTSPLQLTQPSVTITGTPGVTVQGTTTLLEVPNGSSAFVYNLRFSSSGATAITVAAQGGLLLSGVTISNSRASACAAISSASVASPTVTIVLSTISANTTTSGDGTICNQGVMTIDRSTIEGNVNSGSGAVVNEGAAAQLTVVASTFYQNTSVRGAGLALLGGYAGVVNSTFYANSSSALGSAAYVAGGAALALNNSTMYANVSSAATPAQLVIDPAGKALLLNSIVAAANNGTLAPDVAGALSTSLMTPEGSDNLAGYNIIQNASALTDPSSSDRFISPGVGTFGANGGPTMTLLLNLGSAAIASANPANGSCPSMDQRGQPRPFPMNPNHQCDLGAVEGTVPTT